MENKVKLAVSCSPEWKNRLELYAQEKGLSMSAVVVFAVDQWITNDVLANVRPDKKKYEPDLQP